MTTNRNGGPALVAAAAPEIPGARRPVDHARALSAARELLRALGADVDSEGLLETPRRVADAYAELLTPEPFDATTFPNDGGYDELVLLTDISFTSLCEHHLLPFTGVAHIGYLPGDHILGLSKLPRLVEHRSRRLQVQERLTVEIADWLEGSLRPRGVGVVLEARHGCMAVRGVRQPEAVTTTSALRGRLREDGRTRQEFLDLIAGARPRRGG